MKVGKMQIKIFIYKYIYNFPIKQFERKIFFNS